MGKGDGHGHGLADGNGNGNGQTGKENGDVLDRPGGGPNGPREGEGDMTTEDKTGARWGRGRGGGENAAEYALREHVVDLRRWKTLF